MQTFPEFTALTNLELHELGCIYAFMTNPVCKQLEKLGQRQWGSAKHEPGVPQRTTFRSKPQFQLLESLYGYEDVIDHRFQWAVRSVPLNGRFAFWAVRLLEGCDPEYAEEDDIYYLVRSLSLEQECTHRTLIETMERAFEDGPLLASITVGGIS